MSDFTIDSCSTCSAQIIWAITAKAKRMPVNAEPEPGGNVALDFRPGMDPLARVLNVTQQFGVKNLKAIQLGAKAIDIRELGAIIRGRRAVSTGIRAPVPAGNRGKA